MSKPVIIIGIIIIIISSIVLASLIANMLFNKKVEKDIKLFVNGNMNANNEIIQKGDLEGLPACVQKWLEYSQVIGKERIRTVRLKQKGVMRTKEGGQWMAAKAEQYFTVNEPGFIWKADVTAAPLLHLAGEDKYYEGKGHMLIKLLSLIPVVNARGPEIDQGTLLRYLGEMSWFPTAALCDYIKWEEIDTYSARATMSCGGVSASAVFTFNDKGEVVSFIANRYREIGGKYELTDWGGITRGYKEFNGILIPHKIDVIWKLKTGDFNWYKCEITEIEYNNPVIY